MDLLEAIQYRAGLILSGCWRGTNRVKLYRELGWESLSERRHIRRLMLYYKINANLTPHYLKDNMHSCPPATTVRFKNYFFPYCRKHWNELPANYRSIATYSMFKSTLEKSVRPRKQPYFGIVDPFGLRLLTQLRVDLNDLREHRFRHGFANCPSPICACGREIESTSHYLHRCPRFNAQRNELHSNIRSLDAADTVFSSNPDVFTATLLYGMKNLTCDNNRLILEATIDFIKKSNRFDKLEAFA